MDEPRVELYNEDVFEFLQQIPDKSVNMVLTDPPYNVGKAAWDKIDGYFDWCGRWIREVHRVLKDNGVFYVWHSEIPAIARILEMVRTERLFEFNSFCIWNKGETYRAVAHQNRVAGGKTAIREWFNICEYCVELFKISPGAGLWASRTGMERLNSNPEAWKPIKEWYRAELERLGITDDDVKRAYTEFTGRPPHMVRHYFADSQFALPTREIWENVFVARLGLRREYEDLRHYHQVDERHVNVFDVPVVQAAQKVSGHPCEKPQKILRRLIRVGTREDGVVLDPFMGGAAQASRPSRRAARSSGTIGIRIGTKLRKNGSKGRPRSCGCGEMRKRIVNTILGPDGTLFFECDRKACEKCVPECGYTTKREHAIGRWMEIPEDPKTGEALKQ